MYFYNWRIIWLAFWTFVQPIPRLLQEYLRPVLADTGNMKAMILHTLNLQHRYLIILIKLTTNSTTRNWGGLNWIPFSINTLLLRYNIRIALFYSYRLGLFYPHWLLILIVVEERIPLDRLISAWRILHIIRLVGDRWSSINRSIIVYSDRRRLVGSILRSKATTKVPATNSSPDYDHE